LPLKSQWTTWRGFQIIIRGFVAWRQKPRLIGSCRCERLSGAAGRDLQNKMWRPVVTPEYRLICAGVTIFRKRAGCSQGKSRIWIRRS